MKRIFLSLVFLMAIFTLAAAQELNTPASSPKASITQVVGLSEVSITYSRPGVKGREIFGGLVPYGEVWRTGANASTTIKFSDDVSLNGNKVTAGEYALFTIPGEKEWTIIISPNIDWGTGKYKEADDVTRFKAASKASEVKIERFTIEVNDITDSDANIVIKWDRTQVGFKLEVDTDSKVMGQIEKVMKIKDLNDANIYYRAADFYFGKEKDLKTALAWAEKAVTLKPEAFWMIRLKSRIQAKLGDYSNAIATANTSIEMAEKAANKDYVRMNKASISEWQKML